MSEVSISVLEDWVALLQRLNDVSKEAQMQKIKDLSQEKTLKLGRSSCRCVWKSCSRSKREKEQAIAFLELVKRMKVSASEAWLAFLLGNYNYRLRRTDEDFYSVSGIEVVMKKHS